MVRIPDLFLILFMCICFGAAAQRPTVASIDKNNGPMKDVVTIAGSDFGTDPSKLKVFFGGASATIISVTNQLLTVQVPAGATYDNVSVTNTTSGLSSYSGDQFFLNFNGGHGLTAANFGTQADFQGQSGLYDLCLCDFNGDNKVDIATAGDNSNSLGVFQNTSTVGTVTLTQGTTLFQAKSIHNTCGDLNGDGKPEVILTEGLDGDRVFIFRGTGAFSSLPAIAIKLTGRKVKRVAIADLDLDGKPELIITDKGSNIITILPNQSTVSTIAFGTPTTISASGAGSTDALEVTDMNGNGLPEIITSQFNSDPSNIYIFDNKSATGTFNFSDATTLALAKAVVNIRVGDIDGDQKPDIAATRLLGSDVSILLNKSTGTQLAFAAPVSIATAQRPWGIDLGDLDGDGKLDIAVASITQKSISILNNESTPGSLSFAPVLSIPTTYITRHIRIGDIDGDGKPDLAFTSIDNNNAQTQSEVAVSKISVIRNLSCFTPTVSPKGPMSICSGFPLKLTSSEGGGVSYDWKKDGTSAKTGPDAFLDITASGNYTVSAISEGGACTTTSNAVSVTVSTPGAGLTGTGTASSNGPVCAGDDLKLQINDVGATEYRWTGPNGFTATGLTPSRSDFSIEDAGTYTVDLILGSCVAQSVTTVVEGVDNPDFTVAFSGSAQICEGSSKVLTISPEPSSGYTYQWVEKSAGLIQGETGPSLSVTTSGEYSVKVNSPFAGCSPRQTPFAELTALSLPVAAFTPSATNACVGQVITFTNQSTADPQATPSFAWTFGDTHTSSDNSPSNTYASPGTYSVKLVVTYDAGACPSEVTQSITVITAPSVEITTAGNAARICPGDTLRLGVSGDTFTSYAWSTGATTPTILINEPQDYSVTVTNAAGCIIQKDKVIDVFDAPTVTATVQSQKTEIKVGDNVTLNATGLENYIWRPSLGLSDSTIANPVATPLQTMTYTVSGEDINGCTGSAEVTITVFGTAALDLIKPSLYFSPNDDAYNPYWTVENIENFPQCTVSVFNDKGAKVFETKNYTNTWDGTFKGSRLPGGVYYYVIRCDDESGVKTGSITLLR